MPHDEARGAQLAQTHGQVNAQYLREVIEREFPDIRRGIETYVWRWRLARDRDEVRSLAEEVMQEVVVRALDRPDAFNPARSAHGWLLGIGLNVLREQIRHLQRDRENMVQLVAPIDGYDFAMGVTSDQLRQTFDMVLQNRDSLAELLELVSPQDQLILRYRYVEGLNGHELAMALGIRENAARVRLSRALQRLTAAYHEAEQAGKGGRE